MVAVVIGTIWLLVIASTHIIWYENLTLLMRMSSKGVCDPQPLAQQYTLEPPDVFCSL